LSLSIWGAVRGASASAILASGLVVAGVWSGTTFVTKALGLHGSSIFGQGQAATPLGRGLRAPGYNFPVVSRGDRFAPRGLDPRPGIIGWHRYGPLIKVIANQQGIDPHVLGAYVWVESGFNPKQDYRRGKLRALGLGSVQATDYKRYTSRELQDPALNLTLTAKEFHWRWHRNDVAGTVMDVWYPAWRKLGGKPVPVIRTPGVYLQAIANRYEALCRIDGLETPLGRPTIVASH
jgi:hypothetical protein